ncbi:MAG: hypothetical protein WBB22_07975 [Anaerolineae bacterium]
MQVRDLEADIDGFSAVGPVAALCHWQGKTKVQQMNRELSIEVFLIHLRTALYESIWARLRMPSPGGVCSALGAKGRRNHEHA